MHQNNIGSLRFIGAFLVLFGHGYTLAGGEGTRDPISHWIVSYSPFHQGLPGLGVALFFVLSGYLVTASFVRRGNLIDYAVARVLRIYPALIVAVLFCAFFVGLLATTLPALSYLSHHETLLFTLQNSSLWGIHHTLPGVFADLPWKNSVNGSLWTLPFELVMYVSVACVGCCGLFRSRVWFNALAIIAILLFAFAAKLLPFFDHPAHVYPAMAFLFGSLFFINREYLKPNAFGFIILLVLSVFSFNSGAYNTVSLFCFAYFILGIGLSERSLLPVFDKHGDFSYGLYLYAFPLQQLSVYYFGGDNTLLINTIAFCGAMTMAAVSWKFVESPCLLLKKPLSSRLVALFNRSTAAQT
ncbi:MAG: acyltransferase family protein [Pseudomonadales bacterium]